MPLPADPHLLDVCSDVVIRFKGHDSYGGPGGALRALQRRVPAFSVEDCRAAFEVLCAVYDRAVVAIRRHPAKCPVGKTKYARPEDIDFEACMRELEDIEPGSAMNEKRGILNWVIFWHYLK